MTDDDFEDALEFALRAVVSARKFSLRTENAPVPVSLKVDDSVVTTVDYEIETFLKSQISVAYPGCGILGEESGRSGDNVEKVWVIDICDFKKVSIS